MSIINQTLRELDARRLIPTPPPHPLHPADPALRRRPVLWAMAGVLLCALALAAWIMSRPAEPVRQASAGAAHHSPTPQASSRVVTEPSAPPDVAVVATVAVEPEKSVAPDRPDVAMARVEHVPEVSTPAVLPEVAGAKKHAAANTSQPQIQKNINQPTTEEEAEDRYRKAVTLLRQGRENQARPLLEETIRLSPGHVAARQTLAAMLSEAGRNQEAEAVLRAGRVVAPDNAWFALSLARLQAARGDAQSAAATLQSGLGTGGVNADYHATLAALQLQLKQYPDAVLHYQQALRLQPDQGAWWVGLGLSWSAQGKSSEARTAFTRALETGGLPERLAEFVRAKLAE